MHNSKTHFSHESLQDRDTIIRYVGALRDGFENKQLCFGIKGKQLTSATSENVKVELKTKKKNRKVTMALSLEWDKKTTVLSPEERLIINSKFHSDYKDMSATHNH